MRLSAMQTCPSRYNRALPQFCAATVTYLLQIRWTWGSVLHCKHDIDTGDAFPIKQSPRRPPFAAREAEDAILDEMLQTGVIEPSNSPWSSPVCMVKKKDDTYRFCIDYRRLNDVTKKDAFLVPDVKDALDSLRGAKYFATIDLLSGYWQLG